MNRTSDKAYVLTVLAIACISLPILGTFAQQLHKARQKNIGTPISSPVLRNQVNKLLSNPEQALVILAKAVDIAQSRLPEQKDIRSVREAFAPLIEQQSKLETEYKILPATDSAKQDLNNISEFAALHIAIKLLQKHILGQLNIHTLKEDIENHESAHVILKDLLGKTQYHKVS